MEHTITVQELIDKLNKVIDKQLPIYFNLSSGEEVGVQGMARRVDPELDEGDTFQSFIRFY